MNDSRLLPLEPEPRSVAEARTWVVEQLAAMGRADLADSARLGLSELVTNAILHGAPPILVRIGGTPTHPRVEVHDASTMPPAARDLRDEARLLATVGRGLSIVAMYSTSWGADIAGDGKVVWFEPAAEPATGPVADPADGVSGRVSPAPGEIFDLSERLDAMAAPDDASDHRVRVVLVGLPVRIFARYQIWYEELRRELRLLALNHGVDYPLASELTELTLRSAQEHRHSRGLERLDAAVASGLDRVDVDCRVPDTMPATMGRLRELLEEADAFCRAQRLLSMEPDAQQQELRAWYHGEFERQGRGEEPLPWPDGYDVAASRT